MANALLLKIYILVISGMRCSFKILQILEILMERIVLRPFIAINGINLVRPFKPVMPIGPLRKRMKIKIIFQEDYTFCKINLTFCFIDNTVQWLLWHIINFYLKKSILLLAHSLALKIRRLIMIGFLLIGSGIRVPEVLNHGILLLKIISMKIRFVPCLI